MSADKDWNDWRWQARNRIRTLGNWSKCSSCPSQERRGPASRPGRCCRFSITPYYMSLLVPRRSAAAAPPHRRPHRPRVRPLRRRGRRSAGRRTRQPRRRAWSIAIRTASCCWSWTTAPAIAAIAPARGWWGTARSCPTRNGWKRPSTTSAARPPSATCSSPAAIRCCSAKHRLDWILTQLRAIPHVEFIRLGTKMPAVLPATHHPRTCAACCASTIPCG